MVRRLLAASGLLLAGLAAVTPASAGGGCHGSGAKEEAGTTVALAMNCMTPRVLHVPADAEVTFVNNDPMKHNLFGEGWFEEEFGQRESRTHRFSQGTHVYSCTLHAGMVGAIVAGERTAVPIAATNAISAPASGAPWWPAAVGGLVVGAAAVVATTRFRRVRR